MVTRVFDVKKAIQRAQSSNFRLKHGKWMKDRRLELDAGSSTQQGSRRHFRMCRRCRKRKKKKKKKVLLCSYCLVKKNNIRTTLTSSSSSSNRSNSNSSCNNSLKSVLSTTPARSAFAGTFRAACASLAATRWGAFASYEVTNCFSVW